MNNPSTRSRSSSAASVHTPKRDSNASLSSRHSSSNSEKRSSISSHKLKSPFKRPLMPPPISSVGLVKKQRTSTSTSIRNSVAAALAQPFLKLASPKGNRVFKSPGGRHHRQRHLRRTRQPLEELIVRVLQVERTWSSLCGTTCQSFAHCLCEVLVDLRQPHTSSSSDVPNPNQQTPADDPTPESSSIFSNPLCASASTSSTSLVCPSSSSKQILVDSTNASSVESEPQVQVAIPSQLSRLVVSLSSDQIDLKTIKRGSILLLNTSNWICCTVENDASHSISSIAALRPRSTSLIENSLQFATGGGVDAADQSSSCSLPPRGPADADPQQVVDAQACHEIVRPFESLPGTKVLVPMHPLPSTCTMRVLCVSGALLLPFH